MKKVCSLLLVVALLAACMVIPAFAASSVGVSVSGATAAPGETVTLTVSLTGNENGFYSYGFVVDYDEALEFVSVGAGSLSTPSMGGNRVGFYAQNPVTGSGSLFTMTFKVKDSAANGNYSVSLITEDFSDADWDMADVSVSAGTVTVKIPPCANHTWNAGEVTTKPTCTTEGVKKFTCTVCGSTKTESVAKADHTYEWVTTDPTCTEAGYKTGTCSVCKDVKTEAGEAATGHSYTWVTTAPTCTEAGYKTGTCSACGDVKTEAGEAATGHSYTWVTTEPTCTEDGYKTGTCSACGDVKTEAGEAAKGHTPSDSSEVIKEATCTETGLANGVCSVCGAKLDQYETPALGHKYEMTNEVKPTCEAEGSKTYVCANDKTHTYTDKVDALGHDYKVTEEVPATCEAAGSKTYVCGNDASHTYTEEIEALGHKWNSGMVTKEATCSEDGVKTFTCQNDTTHTYTEVIPATGEHVFTNDYDVTEDEHTGSCICGEKGETVKHSYVIEGTVTVKPTATTEGEQEMLCECGAKTTKVLPKVDLDDVPKTGDITNQVVLTAVGMFSLIAAAAYVFKRKLAK